MPCDYHVLPHEGIRTLAPYVPGKPAEEVAREYGITDIIKMASNENPLGCSPLVREALAALSGKQIATYPLLASHGLGKALAQKLCVEETMLTFGNGSDGLFPLILTCFGLHSGKHVLMPEYSFIAYSVYAKTLGIPVAYSPLKPNWQVDVDALITACSKETALIFLANPNNPTGTTLEQKDLIKLISNIPETTLLVLDEAYLEYQEVSYALESITLLAAYPNLILTRTFSKAYGLAGLRIGYTIAHPAISQILTKALPPFSITVAAFVGAEAALEDQRFIQESIALNSNGLKQLQQAFTQLSIESLPAKGNFMTLNYGKDTQWIYQALQRAGIIIRPLHQYGLNNYLRVTVGTSQQNQRFIDTLILCMNKEKRET